MRETVAGGSSQLLVLWTALLVSRLGDPITVILLAYVVYAKTDSALWTATSVVLATLPIALFGPLGGAVADGFGYRRTMVFAEASRALLVALLPILVIAEAPLWSFFLVAFGSAMGGALFAPARFAIVPLIVEPERLVQSNALLVSLDRTVEIIGALLAGVLVITIGAAGFYIDAATFAMSALLLTRLPHDARRQFRFRDLFGSAFDGVRFIRRSDILLANTIVSVLAQLSLPIANGLTPVLLIRKFANGDAQTGAAQFGVAEALLAVGATVASFLVVPVASRVRKGLVLCVGFVAYGIGLAAVGLLGRLELVFLAFCLMGFANVVFYVPNVTIAQENSPLSHRGRVIGARLALVNATWLPAIALAGLLAEAVRVDTVLVFAGVFTALVGLAAAFVPLVRDAT